MLPSSPCSEVGELDSKSGCAGFDSQGCCRWLRDLVGLVCLSPDVGQAQALLQYRPPAELVGVLQAIVDGVHPTLVDGCTALLAEAEHLLTSDELDIIEAKQGLARLLCSSIEVAAVRVVHARACDAMQCSGDRRGAILAALKTRLDRELALVRTIMDAFTNTATATITNAHIL